MNPVPIFPPSGASQLVPLSTITTDESAQARVKIRPAVVRAYAKAMTQQLSQGGLRFPAVVLFTDGQRYFLADGFHRVLAARDAGLAELPAEVRSGNERDALLYSIAANTGHGLPRSNADKRKAVSLLLDDPEWSRWSDHEIARHCQYPLPDPAPLVASSAHSADCTQAVVDVSSRRCSFHHHAAGGHAMLTLHDDSRLGRRDFLRIGSLALGGLSLPAWLTAHGAPSLSTSTMIDRSVIFLFLHGGPSQIETFDPKMSAPSEIRSATGEVKTVVPGMTFGGSFPKLARLADRVSIVRSFTTGDGNHDIKPVVSKDSFGANLGAVYAHLAGANHPETGLPTNAALFPRAVDPKAQQHTSIFGKFESVGPFAASTTPFAPGAGGSLQKDMELKLPRQRIDDRRALLRSFDQVKAALDARAEDFDASQRKAFEVILRGASEAFDLSKESDRTVARYDTAPLVRPENINKKWRNYNNYVDNARSLGKLLLLARRLCERGCGFVTVTTNFVWDMHADVNNAPVEEGMRYMGAPLDHALSAFLEDVEARGLSEKILLVCCGEMGRTPRINRNGGRDHWGNLAPLLLAGGGLKLGQVIGQSDRIGGSPASEPVRIKNLIGTVMHTLFDVGKLRVVRGVPREVLEMSEYKPIVGLQ